MTLTRTTVATLFVATALLAALYLAREEIAAAGPRGTWIAVLDRWTGRVFVCDTIRGGCKLIYPASGVMAPSAGVGPTTNPFDQFDGRAAP